MSGPGDQLEGGFGGGAPTERMPVETPRRAASLTLRGEEALERRAASMDAANQSLADALRITYRLLQVVMVALIALFVFSGFQQVTEGETGIRITLGKIDGGKLEPGFRFSLPYPLGKIEKVQTGQRRLDLNNSFWFFVDKQNEAKPLSQLAQGGGGALKPGRDHSLLTADNNIVHAKLSVVYRCEDPAKFLGSLDPRFEEAIIRASVERATVAVVSTVTIEEVLKRSAEAAAEAPPAVAAAAPDAPGAPAGDAEPAPAAAPPAVTAAPRAGLGRETVIESRIRRAAQESLDALGAGLTLEQVVISDATPPLVVRKDFARVQSAVSAAESERQRAEQERTRTLNEAAGSAYRPLLDLIDAYERLLEGGKKDEAEDALATIGDVLEGKLDGMGVSIAGTSYGEVRISGDAARLIGAAEEYRATVATRAQSQARTFLAKREQHRANPTVFLTSELTDAYKAFLSNPTVELFQLPSGTSPLSLKLTPDPKIARDIEAEVKRRETEANWRLREALRESAASRSTTTEDEKLRQADRERDRKQGVSNP